MSCARTRQMLEAWIDGELDPATSAEIGQHLQSCPDCAARRDGRSALRAALRSAVPPARAPEALRRAVLREVRGAAATAAVPLRGRPSWWQALALAAASSAAAASLAFFLAVPPGRGSAPQQQPIAELVAARHAQSLAGGLIEVASSERHVVKPWFHGKIDFAPPVRDLSAAGIPLLGARLERLGERTAAVLVYRIRNHPVNLFVWRGEQGHAAPLAFETVHGYTLGRWAADGLEFAVVSDVEARDLAPLAARD